MVEVLADFLNGEKRQVWAVRRDSGEAFYLPDGEAAGLREFTKTELRCPYPGCQVPISTRGGMRRDHFFHVNRPLHETGRESEFHLAAKAMLSQWAKGRVPEGAVVREEESVKDAATRRLRRADVMVTGRSGRRVAYEVEYKAFAVEDWRAKQSDYDGQGVVCCWLVGHTRVRLVTGQQSGRGPQECLVRVSALAAEIAAGGYPLLVVNPASRQVGTVAGDAAFTLPYTGRETLAWMAVEPLDRCRFDPRRGIVTPTMRRLTEFEAQRAQEAAREADRLRSLEAGTRAQQGFRARRREAWLSDWETSPLYRLYTQRWGTVPVEIATDSPGSEYILAAPAHWHAVLYDELLHGRGPGDQFGWRDVFVALDSHQIKRSREANSVFGALTAYFQYLQQVGLLRVHRDPRKQVLLFTCTGLTLEQARDAARQEAEAARLRKAERRQARETWIQAEEERRAAEAKARENRARTRLVILEDGTRRWVPK